MTDKSATDDFGKLLAAMSQREFCSLVGTHEHELRRLHRCGIVPNATRGQYGAPHARAYIGYLVSRLYERDPELALRIIEGR